jgi:hypothetical protein
VSGQIRIVTCLKYVMIASIQRIQRRMGLIKGDSERDEEYISQSIRVSFVSVYLIAIIESISIFPYNMSHVRVAASSWT